MLIIYFTSFFFLLSTFFFFLSTFFFLSIFRSLDISLGNSRGTDRKYGHPLSVSSDRAYDAPSEKILADYKVRTFFLYVFLFLFIFLFYFFYVLFFMFFFLCSFIYVLFLFYFFYVLFFQEK